MNMPVISSAENRALPSSPRGNLACPRAVRPPAALAAEMKRLVADPAYVDRILIDGADRARAIADETMKVTKDVVGFVRKR